MWDTSCIDWASRLKNGRSIIPPPLFKDGAGEYLEVFKSLRVVDLHGKPTFGECCDEWVFDFVRSIFGAYDSETGRQLIREYFLLISKKNTKSTIAAGIMLTATIKCWREDEEHLIIAPTKEVADNSYKPAAGMIRSDPELADLFLVQDHIRTITNRNTKSSLKVVSADTDTVSGKKSGRVLVDELWVFGKKSNAESMLMEATGGQASRDEGWVIYLSTQSDEPPAGVFLDKLNYYRDVRDGKIEDRKSLGILYEFPEDMVESKAYLKPENFHITNPNLGRSVSAEWLKDQLVKNQNKQGGAFQQFIAKHLNVQIGLNLRSDRWPGADFWEQCGDNTLNLGNLLQRSEVVTVGIDGGGLDDLLGLAVIGRDSETGIWLHWAKAWAHKSVLERRKSEAPKLRDFERDGDVSIADKVGDDVKEVTGIISIIADTGLLELIGVDQHGIGGIYEGLVGTDKEPGPVTSDQIVGISQGWKLQGAVKTVERKLAGKQIAHCASPLMYWCVGNAKIVQSGNAISITKQASGSAKIDPLMATFNAAQLMALNPEPRGRSSYNERGLIFI